MKRKLKSWVLPFVLCLLCLGANAQYDHLLHKEYSERRPILDSIFLETLFQTDDTTLVLTEIEKLRQTGIKGHDRELELEGVLRKYDYYMHRHMKPEFEKGMQELKAIADRENIMQLRIRARATLAYYYSTVTQRYGPATENMLEYYYLLKGLKSFPAKRSMIGVIGANYYHLGDYDNAIKYLTDAMTAPNDDTWGTYNILTTLGLIYRQKNHFDSAVLCFRQVYDTAARKQDSLWMGIAGGNIGITYFMQGKYDVAIPLLEMDVLQSTRAREYGNAANSLLKLMAIMLKKNEVPKAVEMAVTARELIRNDHDHYNLLEQYYSLMAQASERAGNIALAYRFADSALIAKDSISANMNALALARAEQKVAVERHMAEIEVINKEKTLQTYIRNALVILVFLLAFIGWMFINRQKLRHKQQKELADAELVKASMQLEDFTRSIHEKNELIEQFSTEIEKYQSLPCSNELPTENDVLVKLQQSILLTDEQWETFRINFEKVHAGYLNRLREKLPGLSPAETRFLALSKLKLTNKEMAGMLGIRPDAIRLYRHRLRKKLNLPEDGSIDEVADMI